MADDIDAFLDEKPFDVDSFLDAPQEKPTASPISEDIGLLKGIDEGISRAAVATATPIVAPIDAAIKKVDTAFGEKYPPLVRKAAAVGLGMAARKVADVASEPLELPGIGETGTRLAKDYAAGVVGLGTGIGGALQVVGFENIGDMVSKSAKETAASLMPPDPNIVDAVAQGLGSMSAFMIPGIGITNSARAVAVVAPRLAQFLGVASASILEAGIEAGDVHNRVLDKTGDREQARVAAHRAFFANLPLIHYTNKLGWAGDQSSRAARALESFFVEGGQEGGQQFIANLFAHDPLMTDVAESAFVGGISGGLAGAASHGTFGPEKPPSMPPGGGPGTPPAGPSVPPSAPAAPIAPELILNATEDAEIPIKPPLPITEQAGPQMTAPPAGMLPEPGQAATETVQAPIPTPQQIIDGPEAGPQMTATPPGMLPNQEPVPAPEPEPVTAPPAKPAPKGSKEGPTVTLESGKEVALPKLKKAKGDRGAAAQIKKMDAWLQKTALEDAKSSGNDYLVTMFEGMNPAKLSTSDRDSLNEHLFGDVDGVNLKTGERIAKSAPATPAPAVEKPAVPSPEEVAGPDGADETEDDGGETPAMLEAEGKADEGGAKIEGIKRSILERFSEVLTWESDQPQTNLKPVQLEKFANAGLLDPKDFTTTPLARKAMAELNRIKGLMTKGYIDRPDLVEPRRLTFKSILKWIADMGRFSLFQTFEQGWITDGRIMFKTIPDDAATFATFKHLAVGQAPNLDGVLKSAESATDQVTGILGAADSTQDKPTFLLGTEGGRHIIVAAESYNFLKSRYPDSKMFATRNDAPIRVEEHGEIVGVMMPMRGTASAPVVYSVETGEAIKSQLNPGRAEVDAKMKEAEDLRKQVEVRRLVIKANDKEIGTRDDSPGEKTAVAIAKIAGLQNENIAQDTAIQELQKQIATIEEQAAALREEHGIEDIPASGLVRRRPKAKKSKGGKGGTKGASKGDFAFDTPVEMGGMEHIKPFRMPELVRLAYELMGKVPAIGGLIAYNGYSKAGLGMEIRLNPTIFKKPEQAAKTLAHEIGHLVDYLPDFTLKRGNLLGSLRSLRSHLANTFGNLQVTNKELRDELLAVTMYWRPYDPQASSQSFISYRRSARELYADAISLMFNSPGTLERMAPKFYAGWFDALDKKPAVKLAFFEIQAFLNSPELKIQESRELDRRAMYLTAEDLWKKKRAEKTVRDTRYGEWFRQLIVDKNQKIIGQVDAAASNGRPLPASMDPRYILEEMSLADNQNHAFLEEVDAKVIKPMADSEISHLDMGDYLYLTRVANGDRQAFANPKGYTPEEAAKSLDFMKGRLGPERYAALESAAGAFRDIVFKVSEEAVAVGAYNRKVFDEKIEPNRGNYAVFAVQEYLEDYISAGVKEQIGTFKDIASPFTATVMKVIGLNRLIAKQKGANAVRDFLIPRGEAEQAEVVARGDKLAQFRAKKGFGLLEMLEDGKPVAYYVDPYIAEAFERKEAGTFNLAVKLLDSVFNGIFRPLYITFNLGFQLFSNPIRDFSRTRRNVYALIQNQGYAGTVKSLLVEYARNLGAAGRRSAGIADALVSEMIANKSLDITFTDYSFDPEADQYTSVLRKMGLSAPGQDGLYDRASKIRILKPVFALLEGIRFIGNTFESISKIAGYKVLKADALSSLSKAIAEEKDPATKSIYQDQYKLLLKGEGEYSHAVAYQVRNYVGTPNWRRKGTVTRITNTIFPFSNIMIQGYRSDLEMATKPNTRTGFMFDMVLTQIMPKLLMFLAAMGGAGDDLKEFFRKVSEYDKSNYMIIPIGWEDGEGGKRKAIYLRLPHDETGRFTAAIFWKMANAMRGDITALQQIINFGAGQMPNLAPPLTIGATWVAYLSGKNPYDDFRGRPILPEKVFRAGGTYALKRMVQWTFNMAGLSSFATHDDANKSTAESITEMTPLLNRMIKISDYGEREEDMRALSKKQSEDAMASLDRGVAAKAYSFERYLLSQKLSTKEISSEERVRLARLNKYHSSYEIYSKAIRRARDKGNVDKAQAYEDKLESMLSKVIR